MKQFPVLLIVVALVPPLLTGCGNSGGTSGANGNTGSAPPAIVPSSTHKIVSQHATSKNNIVEVQVSPGSANTLLAKWSSEIVQANKTKKNLQVNFYDGKPGKDTLIARFENGKLFDPLRPNRILMPKPK